MIFVDDNFTLSSSNVNKDKNSVNIQIVADWEYSVTIMVVIK